MGYRRTLKIPVHYATTGRKLNILDNLTARLTYAVRSLNEKVVKKMEGGGEPPESRQDIRAHSKELGKTTGLSAGFVQQVEDKVLWAWKQYAKAHERWERLMLKAGDGSQWREKLEKREPSYPFTSGNSKKKKIPIRLDERTGDVQEADLELTDWVAHISTLRKGETVDILLNPSDWHEKQLEEAEEIKSFEIVWHFERDKFMIHITCEYQAPPSNREGVVGVDLGVVRPLSAVLMGEEGFRGFEILRSEKRERLQELNDRISHLRRLEKWEALKKLRHKRRRVAEDYDRKLAKRFAQMTQRFVAFVSNPKYIRYRKFRGDNDRAGRKVLQHWSFRRQAEMIEREKRKLGDEALTLVEWGTSSECCNCGGNTERVSRDRVVCEECGAEYDAEFNSARNIAAQGISLLCEKSSEPFWQDLAGVADGTTQNGR